MNMKQNISTILCTGLFSAAALAGEVDDANVTTFQANTPAIAAEVNTTIGALVTAINDNAQRIASLESGSATEAIDVSGHSYRFAEIEAGAHASDDARSTLGSVFGFSSVITFDESGVGTIAQAPSFDLVIDTRTSKVNSQQLGHDIIVDSIASDFFFNDPDSTSFTYTQTGSLVQIDDGEGTVDFYVAGDGSVLIGHSMESDGPPGYGGGYVSLLVAVRVQ